MLFGVFSFYPFLRNFKLMLYETPPVPGPAGALRRAAPDRPDHHLDPVHPEPRHHAASSSSWWCRSASSLGLALAVAAHRKLKGMAVYRVIFSSTVVSSVAVASVVFGTLLNPVVGLLPWLGINPTPPALESTTWALPAVALITIWQFLGLSFIIMSAGLQSVPDELLEAARIDGAGRLDALLAHDRAAALPHHLLRRGREHHLRLPGLRRGRHPHRARRTRCACTPTC